MGNVVHLITLSSALNDGTVILVTNTWDHLTQGKPIVMTPALRRIVDDEDKLNHLMRLYEPLYHSTAYPHDEYGWIIPVFGTEVRVFEDERAFTMMLDEEWI